MADRIGVITPGARSSWSRTSTATLMQKLGKKHLKLTAPLHDCRPRSPMDARSPTALARSTGWLQASDARRTAASSPDL